MQLASEISGKHLSGTFGDVVRGMTAGDESRYARDAAARFLDAGRGALRAGADSSAFIETRDGIARTLEFIETLHYLRS